MRHDEDFEKIEEVANRIEEKSNHGKNVPGGDIGICRDCFWCSGYERELGNVYYKCDQFGRSLNLTKPKIIKCTSFQKKEDMFLQEMHGMAWIIDSNKKIVKGFGK